MYIYIYIYIYIYTHISCVRIHRQHPYLSFCQKEPPTPSNKCFHRLAEPPHPRSPYAKWNKLHIHERICISSSEREANVHTNVHNTFLTYRPAYAWCSQHLWMHAYSPQKMHMRSCMCAYATAQKLLCHKTIANLSWVLREHRADCRLPPAQPPAQLLSRPIPSPDAVRSRNPSKSTLAHDAVAATGMHKHYSIIRLGVDLIQFVYGSHSPLATEVTHHRHIHSPFFRASFIYIYINICIYIYI